MYKINKMNDITFDFFENYNNILTNIQFTHLLKYDGEILHMQYKNYVKIDFDNICPFVEKYFQPSANIISTNADLLKKYDIIADEYIGVYYRGTDKIKELNLCDFSQFEYKVKEILNNGNNQKLKILLVTDSKQMLDYFSSKFENIVFVEENKVSSSNNGIHNENCSSVNYSDIMYLFATFIILSKCKYYVCGSNNGALWTMYYRGNGKNVYQNFNNEWIS
jgi:hypothetical protein